MIYLKCPPIWCFAKSRVLTRLEIVAHEINVLDAQNWTPKKMLLNFFFQKKKQKKADISKFFYRNFSKLFSNFFLKKVIVQGEETHSAVAVKKENLTMAQAKLSTT